MNIVIKKFYLQALVKTIYGFCLTSFHIFLVVLLSNSISTVSAQETANDFVIIPQASNQARVNGVVRSLGNIHKDTNKDPDKNFWDIYREKAAELEQSDNSLGNQMASGVMSWDTVLDYFVYLIRFASQIGLLIGALMIIYSGYTYATAVFSGGNASNDPIKFAVYGILVIAFSYAIMRILMSAFL